MTGKVLSVVVLALFLVGPTGAQHPTEHGYGGDGGITQTSVDRGSSLPFTGFDLALLVVSGIFLLAAGFALRKVGRRPV